MKLDITQKKSKTSLETHTRASDNWSKVQKVPAQRPSGKDGNEDHHEELCPENDQKAQVQMHV